jgi:hypothetical protein
MAKVRNCKSQNPHNTILKFWYPGDLSLSQKLHEELKFEQESAAEDAYSPAFLEAFKEDGVWNVCLSICEVFSLSSKV